MKGRPLIKKFVEHPKLVELRKQMVADFDSTSTIVRTRDHG